MEIRKYIFYVAWFIATTLMCLVLAPFFPFPKFIRKTRTVWPHISLFLLKAICNVRYRVIGANNLPTGNYIVVSKHQSVLETVVLPLALKAAIFILKKELGQIPIIGTYLRLLGMIEVDRADGRQALQHIKQELQKVEPNTVVVIFPEGTRTTVGVRTERYHAAGVALVYETLKWPVVPVAVNTGAFWPRDGKMRQGVATIEILKPINPEQLLGHPHGYDRKVFLEELNKVVEDKSLELYKSKI